MLARPAASPLARAGELSEPRAIPLFDLQRQQARLRADIDRRIARVLDHGQYVLGPEVTELEEKIAAFAGVPHAIGVSSGRDALIMALMALGVGPGDAVFVPAFTFSATAAVVISVGATPIFVDVDEHSFNIDPARLDEAVRAVRSAGVLRPRVVMPVDLYGLPADYDRIGLVADAYGLSVLADAAQSFGAARGEARVGGLAPISCVSFYPTKPLGAFGDGGAVLTSDDQLADAVRQIRTHGRRGDGDEALRIGMTGRLDTIQAAVLLAKLQVFRAELNRREEVAQRYDAALAGRVATPARTNSERSAWALYTIKLDDRDRVRAALQADGIGTGLFYPTPLHRHGAFTHVVPEGARFAVAERLCAQVLSLPIGPDIADDEVDFVAERILAALGA